MRLQTGLSKRVIGLAITTPLVAISGIGSDAGASWRGKNGDIYIVKSNGASASVQRHLSDGTPAGTVVDCVVPDSRINTSPDGKMMTYSCAEDGDPEIYVTHLGEGDAIKLTNNDFDDLDPTFNRDGSKVVFSSDRDGNFEIYSVDIGASAQTRLTRITPPGTARLSGQRATAATTCSSS